MGELQFISVSDYKAKSGKTMDIQLSYQLFGIALGKAPVVLINHALTGNSNVAGLDGWWNEVVGPGKTIDTNNYTVLSFNIPGNGYDGVPNNLIVDYKSLVASDVANVFATALQLLGVKKLFAVIGGSVGGGLAWELAALKPNFIEHLIPIAADWKSTDWIIANCHIQDRILNHSSAPLEDARMHAMTLYRTPESLSSKFDRTLENQSCYAVESWLNHHGKILADRFQLSAYKMMNQILKTIDITAGGNNFESIIDKLTSNVHIVTVDSDLFFKSSENWETYVNSKIIKDNVNIYEIQSVHGHDAFLMEYAQLNEILKSIFQHSKVLKNPAQIASLSRS
jgi:homoserine O-acetyltransferase